MEVHPLGVLPANRNVFVPAASFVGGHPRSHTALLRSLDRAAQDGLILLAVASVLTRVATG